jgi:hypothetical protein
VETVIEYEEMKGETNDYEKWRNTMGEGREGEF